MTINLVVFVSVLIFIVYHGLVSMGIYRIARIQRISSSWVVFLPVIGSWFVGVIACNIRRWNISLTPLFSVISAALLPLFIWQLLIGANVTLPLALCCCYQFHVVSLVYDLYFRQHWVSMLMAVLNPIGAVVVLFKINSQGRRV